MKITFRNITLFVQFSQFSDKKLTAIAHS